MLLAKFLIENRTFEVSGDYDIVEYKDYKLDKYRYPEFENLSAMEIVDNNPVPYKPEGYSFTGSKYDEYTMIQSCISAAIMNNKDYTILYLEPKLQAIINEYHKDISYTYNNIKIPNRVLNSNFDIYELILVTNNYIYYIFDEEMIIISALDHFIISDNYFANIGYSESLDDIEKGIEKKLWEAVY